MGSRQLPRDGQRPAGRGGWSFWERLARPRPAGCGSRCHSAHRRRRHTPRLTDGGSAVDARGAAIEGGRTGFARVYRSGSTSEELIIQAIPSPRNRLRHPASISSPSRALWIIPAGATNRRYRHPGNQRHRRRIPGARSNHAQPAQPLPESEPNYAGLIHQHQRGYREQRLPSGPRPTISIAAHQAASEGGSQGVTRITLSDAPVNVARRHVRDRRDPSTAAANDYVPLSATVTIPANQTTADISISAIDTSPRGDRATPYHLRAPTDSSMSSRRPLRPRSTFLITNHPSIPTTPWYDCVPHRNGRKGAWQAASELSRTGNVTEPLTVDYAINWTAGHAVIGSDFELRPARRPPARPGWKRDVPRWRNDHGHHDYRHRRHPSRKQRGRLPVAGGGHFWRVFTGQPQDGQRLDCGKPRITPVPQATALAPQPTRANRRTTTHNTFDLTLAGPSPEPLPAS